MPYTRTGDNGDSGLFGTNTRLQKDDPVYEALGTLDELNSLLGLCRASITTAHATLCTQLLQTQEVLFMVQAELAGAGERVTHTHIARLEHNTDQLEAHIGPNRSFTIPGSTEAAAWLDYARATARKAERRVIRAHTKYPISAETKAYMNRLSSFLYAAARHAAARENVAETSPAY